MCLYVKEKSCKQTAKSDIVVYKHLKLRNGILLTTYQNSVVKIGETYGSELLRYCSSIEEGLHSFVNIRKCISDGKCERASVIVKCVIPKDSSYYVGSFFGAKSYASDKLTYVEIIKTL